MIRNPYLDAADEVLKQPAKIQSIPFCFLRKGGGSNGISARLSLALSAANSALDEKRYPLA